MSPRAIVAVGWIVMLTACATRGGDVTTSGTAVPDVVVQYTLTTTPSGELVAWNDAAGGLSGTITPLRTFKNAALFCRDYQVTTRHVDGSGSVSQATACRSTEGQWRSPAVPL